MASADKITRFLRGAFLGAALGFTSQQAWSGELAATGQPTLSAQNDFCLNAEATLANLPQMPPEAYSHVSNIYELYSQYEIGGVAPFDIEGFRQTFMKEQYFSSPEEFAGLNQIEMPKYERFVEQHKNLKNGWPESPASQMMTMLKTLMGIDALRNILGDIMHESPLEKEIANSVDVLSDIVGITEADDYRIMDDMINCQQEPLIIAPASPVPANGAPASHPHLLLG